MDSVEEVIDFDRNWVLIRSVILEFFTTEKSTDAKPGPWYLSRGLVPNVPEQDAQGLTRVAPLLLKACDTPAKGANLIWIDSITARLPAAMGFCDQLTR